jgi:hypothetical protein
LNLGIILSITLALNLCFGYFRAHTRRFTWPWFVYIHLPIPLVIFMRVVGGFGYTLIPVLVVTSALGQWSGGKLMRAKQKASQ